MGTTKWSVVKPSIVAVIDGKEVECLQFAATFELNAIPQAQLDVAVGRNLKTGKAAAIHSLAGLFNVIKPKVQVYLKLQVGDNGNEINWGPITNPGGALVFDGYATHSAPSVSRGQSQVRIPLQHWLNDLDKASAISGASHPGNPGDFVYPAAFKVIETSGTGADGTPGWTALTDFEKGISPTMFESGDGMWGVLKEWSTQISKQDPVDERLAKSTGNAKARAALERMPTLINTQLDLSGVNDGTSIGHGILHLLHSSMSRNAVNTTLWGKLVGEWCPEFFMAVVPRVNDALVIPFTGPLAGPPENYLTIPPDHYDSIASDVAAANSISAIGIYFAATDSFGENGSPDGTKKNELAAVFPQAAESGMVLMKDAPIWLANSREPGLYAGMATGIRDRKAIRTTIGGTGEDSPPSPDEAAKDYETMLARLAQQWFAVEKTKDRVLELRTYLRFDIAPGSQILIKGTHEDFIVDDNLGTDYYGIVVKVSHVVSRRAVFTTLTVGYLRTPKENESELYSVVKPPLFKKGFYGAPLITP